MGREGGDPTLITSSSIALLQERFRQLQKVRENREKRELLKLLSEGEHTGRGTAYGRRSTSSFHHHHQPDAVVSDHHDHQNTIIGPDHEYSLSLGLNTTMSSTCFWGGDHAAAGAGAGAGASTSSRNQADQINTDHVDTSLHL